MILALSLLCLYLYLIGGLMAAHFATDDEDSKTTRITIFFMWPIFTPLAAIISYKNDD